MLASRRDSGRGEHDTTRIDFHTFLSLMSRKLKETAPRAYETTLPHASELVVYMFSIRERL